MKHLKTTVAALVLAFGVSTTANAQLFGGLDSNTLAGGLTGAGAGAGIGALIAPSGNNVEGAAIGALVGGLGGAAFGNQQSNFAGNPFAGQFNPGFTGRNLIGTGIGAGIGGAIGSNLAGSGVREEGTAIGAVLGGVAGYALSNQGQGQQFAGQQFGAPVGFDPQPTNFSPQPFGFGGQTVFSGQYVAGPIIQGPTHYIQEPVQTRHQHLVPNITVAAPNVRLAGPAIRERVIYRGVTHIEQMPIVRAQHISAPPITQTITVHQPVTQRIVRQPIVTRQYVDQPVQYIDEPAPQPVIAQPVTQPVTLCYAGSSKRYDSWGNEIKGGSCGR